MQHRLTDKERIEVVEKYLTGNYTCASLGREYRITTTAIWRLLKRRNIKIFGDQIVLQKKYNVDDYFFDNIDTEEKAYFLGLFYADGCVFKNGAMSIVLQREDEYILEKFKNVVNSNAKITRFDRSKKNSKWKDTSTFRIRSRIMSKRLEDIGCVQKKSLCLRFPSLDIVPKHLIHHFIRGYFDGDGCFSVSHSKIYNKKYNKYYPVKIITFNIIGTKWFCNSLADIIFEKFKFHYHIYDTNNNITKSYKISGKKTIKLLDWLYKDATIYLERKYNKYLHEKQLINKKSNKINI